MNTTTSINKTGIPTPALRDLAAMIRRHYEKSENLAEFEAWRAARQDAALNVDKQNKQ